MLPAMAFMAAWHGECIFSDGCMLLTLGAEMTEENMKGELDFTMQGLA
jgi:hypothetical protein